MTMRNVEAHFAKRAGAAFIAALLGCALLCAGGSLLAQDPTTTLPRNYQNIFENQAVAVIHAHYEPHEKIPLHDHSKFPTIYVYLSDSGPVLFSHVEAHPFSVVRTPLKTGAYRVSPGRIERHTVENQGDIPTDFLRVELKELPIGHFTSEFRAAAPSDLSRNADSIEFKNADLQTERIVCVAGSACEIKAANWPSLVIAFTPVQLAKGPAAAQPLKAGAVQWMDAGESLSLSADSSAPGHVLRILLPSSK
jgi:hypothetical protein